MESRGIKKGVRIKIQPRFKIQYPMKNRCKNNKTILLNKIRSEYFKNNLSTVYVSKCYLRIVKIREFQFWE